MVSTMASKRERTIKNLILVLTIFVWLGVLTVHQITEFRVTEHKETGREKRSLNPNPSTSGGASYIRWGRKDCPHDTELVYRGFAGGGYYDHVGGGSNYVCLTDNPSYANIKAGEDGYGVIYGTEFILHANNGLFATGNSHPHNLEYTDVQCSVCRSHSRSSMVMIPGTKECPAGWNKEYWGYLMTGHYAHKGKHDFVCVDNSPDRGTEGGRKNENGARMDHVEGRCGSLPCQPYVNGAELTCVVCTK